MIGWDSMQQFRRYSSVGAWGVKAGSSFVRNNQNTTHVLCSNVSAEVAWWQHFISSCIKDKATLNYVLLLGLHYLWWISGTSGVTQGPFQWNMDGHFCPSGSLGLWETSWFCDLSFSVVGSVASLLRNGAWPLPRAVGNSSKFGQGGFFCMGFRREKKG